MTHQELKQVGDAFAEASIASVIAAINARAASYRVAETDFKAAAFTHEARHASTLGLIGDAGARRRLAAVGVLS